MVYYSHCRLGYTLRKRLYDMRHIVDPALWLLKTALRHRWHVFHRTQPNVEQSLTNWPISSSIRDKSIWHQILRNWKACQRLCTDNNYFAVARLRVRDSQLSYRTSRLCTPISDRARALFRNTSTVMKRTVPWNKWGESSVCVSTKYP